MSFLLFKGLLSKHFRLIALSLVVVFLYGGMIWYIFPVKEKMSWEGHLSGFVVGILFSLIFKSSIAKPIKYAWEQPDFDASDDPFLQQFDEDGNFIEPPNHEQDSKISIHYSFKEEE
jgi:zinc transporter ZupT